MKVFNYNFRFSHTPPVLKRGRHALIAVLDKDHNFVLGSKKIYPQNIYRLIGGGIDENEDPKLGAARELAEELLIKVDPDKLKFLAQFNANIKDDKKYYFFQTFLFFYQLTDEKIQASDDLQKVEILTVKQMEQLIDNFYHLPSELINLDENLENSFCWSDYGQYYGKIHQEALNLISQKLKMAPSQD